MENKKVPELRAEAKRLGSKRSSRLRKQHKRQVGWRKEFNDLIKTGWPKGKESRRLKECEISLCHWWAGRWPEASHRSRVVSRVVFNIELWIKVSLYSTIWKMDQSVVSLEKSFRLVHLELSCLLKEFVDLKIKKKWVS